MRFEAPEVKLFEIGMAIAIEFRDDIHAVEKLYARLESRMTVFDWRALGPVQVVCTCSTLFSDLCYLKLIVPYVKYEDWDRLHFNDRVI